MGASIFLFAFVGAAIRYLCPSGKQGDLKIYLRVVVCCGRSLKYLLHKSLDV